MKSGSSRNNQQPSRGAIPGKDRMMNGMIRNEVLRNKKRKVLADQCGDNHTFVDVPIPDPVDKRYKLIPTKCKFGNDTYEVRYCMNCGTAKAFE